MVDRIKLQEIINDVVEKYKAFFDEFEIQVLAKINYNSFAVYQLYPYARKHSLTYENLISILESETEEGCKKTIEFIAKDILKKF